MNKTELYIYIYIYIYNLGHFANFINPFFLSENYQTIEKKEQFNIKSDEVG